jgi:hypothetical protein
MSRARVLAALLAVALCGGLAGCGKPAVADQLLGSWYESRTGAQYRFVSRDVLVVPDAQPGSGNAVTYSVVGDDRLDVRAAGSHRVSIIDKLTTATLVLADPLSGRTEPFFRDAAKTTFAARLASGALRHASQASSLTAGPDIVWVARKPAKAWARDWATSTFDVYATSWDWAALKRTALPVKSAGGGDTLAFSFTFARKVPSASALASASAAADPSSEPTAGRRYIDVGYSASKAAYPAGTLVYLPGGMIYSLGDGYAIAVGLDSKAEGFFPITHD